MDDDGTLEPLAVPSDVPNRLADDAAAGHGPAAVQSLRDAMRRARIDDAERASVLSDLRAARVGRLEILQDALAPLMAQIPKDVDLFDLALVPGASPRLFIDMIGFVEMGRDARIYHLLQDTRHGRVKLAESAQVDTMVTAVTDYVARRLLERDKALAADAIDAQREAQPVARTTPPTSRPTGPTPVEPAPAEPGPDRVDAAPLPRGRKALRFAGIAFLFLIELLGSIAFFAIVIGAGWLLWYKLFGRV